MQTVNKLIQLMMGVTDMAKSKKFYADVLGFAVTTDYGQGASHWVSLSFPDGGVTLTLTTFLGKQEAGTVLQPGTMSLYLAAPDIQQAYNELTAQGVTALNPISDDLYGPGSGVKWFRVADPDGNNLTIVQS
jgi:catechol 2,3-dioxygenase-like lactoylglutathione lyase family enzyme